jgi:hypothetical protein
MVALILTETEKEKAARILFAVRLPLFIVSRTTTKSSAWATPKKLKTAGRVMEVSMRYS